MAEYGPRTSCFAVALSCALLVPLGLLGQESNLPVVGPSLRSDIAFSDHIHRNFGSAQGLPSEYVYDLVQTRDGYVWIATNNGIARFDGNAFRVFNRVTANLPSNDVKNLYEDSKGNLWVGTSSGLAVYRPGSQRFHPIDRLVGQSALAIYEDAQKHLWIGTDSGVYGSPDGEHFEPAFEFPDMVLSICEDGEGTFWLGTEHGLVRYQRGGQPEEYAEILVLIHGRLPMIGPTIVHEVPRCCGASFEAWTAARRSGK